MTAKPKDVRGMLEKNMFASKFWLCLFPKKLPEWNLEGTELWSSGKTLSSIFHSGIMGILFLVTHQRNPLDNWGPRHVALGSLSTPFRRPCSNNGHVTRNDIKPIAECASPFFLYPTLLTRAHINRQPVMSACLQVKDTAISDYTREKVVDFCMSRWQKNRSEK